MNSSEFLELVGAEVPVSYRQLDYWCKAGVIVPAVPADGSGAERVWGRSQVSGVVAVAWLRRCGLELETIGRLEDPEKVWRRVHEFVPELVVVAVGR